MQALDERHQKYKMMEGNLMARKRRLKSQLPDITSSLTLINKLRAKKDANEETNSQFLLSDSVYASAKIPPTDKVTFTFQSCIFFLFYTLRLRYGKCIVRISGILSLFCSIFA